MPRLAELRGRFQAHALIGSAEDTNQHDECLVFDPRNGLTPEQLVERKLGRALLREHGQCETVAPYFRNKPR